MFTVLQQFYLHFVIKVFIYKDANDGSLYKQGFFWISLLGISLCMAHIVISWIGKRYVKSEILKGGNDTLLDNLKEGVIVVDEAVDRVRFINKVGKNLL